MGSASDLPTLEPAAQILDRFDVPYELRVVSAHRTPVAMAEYARTAVERGLKVLIAGAGGAAHLPGMLAAHTVLPVIGVPVSTTALNGIDALLSIVQMPRGVPVATVAIGGGANAGLLAVQMLALEDPELLGRVQAFKDDLAATAREQDAQINR
jgi:5-(carboxyamino)imidazole ribonucleotide mutase